MRKHLDIAAAKATAAGRMRLDLVLTRRQANALRAKGIHVRLLLNARGQSARQAAKTQAAGGYVVWRDYDSKNGIRDFLYKTAAEIRTSRSSR